MKHQPKALHCNHCVIPSAHVWSAPQGRAVNRAAGELLNHSTTKLFHRAVHQQHSQLSKGCQQYCSYCQQRQGHHNEQTTGNTYSKGSKRPLGKKVTCSGACLFITRNEVMNIQNLLDSFYSVKFQK